MGFVKAIITHHFPFTQEYKLSRNNYSFEKRQKELAKKKKQEEKRRRKQEKKGNDTVDASESSKVELEE
jgi:hypothetical protein